MKAGDLVRTVSDNHPYFGIIIEYKKRPIPHHDSVHVYFPYKFNKLFDFSIETKDIKVVDEVR